MSRPRILLADDHAMVRRGLRMVLDAEPDLEVVAEAGDGAEAIERGLRAEVDLAVLDVGDAEADRAAGGGGARAPAPGAARADALDARSEQYLFEALKAGASGYVLKSGADRDLVDACRAAMRGEPFLYPAAMSR